jgi:acyl dehydratase
MRDEIDLQRLADAVGREVLSAWTVVDQEAIDRFADLSDDRQWIHVDPERARRESPYGATIAHGFFTLALLSRLLRDAVTVAGVRTSINYGLDRVRFPAPLASGQRVRGRFTLRRVEPVEGGAQATWAAVIERDAGGKPCCAAEWLVRYLA